MSDNSTSRYVKELLSTRLENLSKSYFNNLGSKLKNKTTKTQATDIIKEEAIKLKKSLNFKQIDLKEAQSFLDSITC
jgi:hypothetical protein